MELRLENAERVREEISKRIARVRVLLSHPLSVLQSRHTDPREHPLLEVLAAAEGWLSNPDFSTARIDGYSIEAVGLAPLIEARASDPALPEILASMVEPGQYLHAVGVLGTAFAMQSLRGVERIELVRKVSQTPGRVPDILVSIGGGDSFWIEAKAPRALRGLNRRVSSKLARRVVQRAISEAANPKSGQLPKDRPGTVAVASHGLADSDVETLVRASISVLDRHGSEDRSLLGVLLVNFYRALRPIRTTDGRELKGRRIIRHTIQLAWGSHRRIIQNPGYIGGFKIDAVAGFEPAADVFDLSQSDTAATGNPGVRNPAR